MASKHRTSNSRRSLASTSNGQNEQFSNYHPYQYSARRRQEESITAYNRCLRVFRWLFVICSLAVISMTILLNTRIAMVATDRWEDYHQNFTDEPFLIKNVNIKMSMALIMGFSTFSIIIYIIGIVSIVRERLDWSQLFLVLIIAHSFAIYMIVNQYRQFSLAIDAFLGLLTTAYMLILVKKVITKQKFQSKQTLSTKSSSAIMSPSTIKHIGTTTTILLSRGSSSSSETSDGSITSTSNSSPSSLHHRHYKGRKKNQKRSPNRRASSSPKNKSISSNLNVNKSTIDSTSSNPNQSFIDDFSPRRMESKSIRININNQQKINNNNL